MRPPFRRFARRLAPLLLPLLAACAAAAKKPSLDASQRREVFEAAWARIPELHYDPQLGGVDWKAVHDSTAPKVDACKSDEELVTVLNEMLGALGHSHVAVFPPDEDVEITIAKKKKSAEAGGRATPSEATKGADAEKGADDDDENDGVVGMRLAGIEEAILVTGVDPGSPADKAGVKLGDEVLSVDGESLDKVRERLKKRFKEHWAGFVSLVAPSVLSGAIGSNVEIEFGRAGGWKRTVALERVASKSEPVKFGLLGTMHSDFEARRLENGVGYVRFSPCFGPQQDLATQAIETMSDAPAVILDLRGNPGGAGAVAMGVSRYFVRDEVDLGSMRTRKDSMSFFVNPTEKPYEGPVVVIVDGSTGSTAEILSGGLQAIGRARVVGTTSMGAALPSTFESLPHGYRLQAVIADFRLPNGSQIEGTGVVPDVAIQPKRADYEAGHDPYLDAAVKEAASAPTIAAATKRAPKQAMAQSGPRAPIEVSDEAAAVMQKMIDAAGGADAIRKRRSTVTKASMELMGLVGTSTTTALAPNRSYTFVEIPGVVQAVEVCDGVHAWSYSSVSGLRELDGEELAVRLRASRMDGPIAWRELYSKVEIVERKRENDRDVIVMRHTPYEGEGEPTTITIDAQTFLPVRIEARMASPMGKISSSTEILEYKEFDGLKEPSRSQVSAGPGKFEVKVNSVEINQPVDEALFSKPDVEALKKANKKAKKKKKESAEGVESQPAGTGAER